MIHHTKCTLVQENTTSDEPIRYTYTLVGAVSEELDTTAMLPVGKAD